MKCKKYLSLVASLPCCICGLKPVQVHHIRENTGIALKSSDFDTIPLCYEHHNGDSGVHGLGVKKFESVYGKQDKFVKLTRAVLGYGGI